jgi:acyl-CoA synthetase (AMP-forming)/AMP-acid ligase II
MIRTAAVGGRSRGALLSHANLIAASAQLLHYWSLTPDDVNFGALPLFHVAGLGMRSPRSMRAARASSCRNSMPGPRWTQFTASGSRCLRNSRRS